MHIPQFYRIYANKYETMKYGGVVNLKNNFISTAYTSSQERKKSITYFLYWFIHTLMQKKTTRNWLHRQDIGRPTTPKDKILNMKNPPRQHLREIKKLIHYKQGVHMP